MTYITRRIQITKLDGTVEELSDIAFAGLHDPMILLGEPGAGKSETALAIKDLWKGILLNADRIVSGAPLLETVENAWPVVDGLDEASANTSEQPIITVLKRLHGAGIKKFCLTCRAADWVHAQNERAVENWFGIRPIVGHLQPLNESEIAQVVDAIGNYDSRGEQFVEDAKRQGALDLARNPQSLRLLLSAILEAGGWPTTKTALFELASLNLAKEENPIHKSIRSNRPEPEAVLNTAGFVCSQVILSGCRGVNIDGQDDDLFPRIAGLASDTVSVNEIEAAISTALFRASGVNCVEPVHRTVAEFLAAKWLFSQLSNGTLSKRRLDTAIYSENTVPTSLRGLHAWLATFDQANTRLMVSKDPYGCLRYGDVAQYPASDVRHLLQRLQDLSTEDPHFRSEDWSAQVCGGLARPELRTEIVSLVKNPEINYHLSTVILESLMGTDLAEQVCDDLRDIVLDDKLPFATRSTALDALPTDRPGDYWVSAIKELCDHDSHDSARLSIAIIRERIDAIEGELIGKAIVNYDRINEERSIGLHIGLDYSLFPKLSDAQLRKIAPILVDELPSGTRNRNDYQRKIQDRVHDTVHSLLKSGAKVEIEEIWCWLNATTRDDYHSNEWNTFSIEYFSSRPAFRREIQTLGLDQATNEDEQWQQIFHFGEIAAGLYLNEDDICHHLGKLLSRGDPPSDLPARWKNLVQWARAHRDFEGKAIRLARAQAQARPELQKIIDDLDNAPQRDWKKEEDKRQRRLKLKRQEQAAVRHEHYSKIAESVRAGQHLGALNEIASTYLGLYHEFSDLGDPVQKVGQLVGNENLPSALKGLITACERDDIPSPRDAMQLSAKEGKSYFLEKITLVACAHHLASGKALKQLPRQILLCALTACQWGLFSGDRHGVNGVEDALRNELFNDKEILLRFVRDTIEPELFNGKDHVSGLYQVTHEQRYSDVIGPLALEWLVNSEQISAQSLHELVAAALRLADDAELLSLIERKIAANNWPSDEHRSIWLSAAFQHSFEQFEERLSAFAAEDASVLWSLCQFMSRDRGTEGVDTPLSTAQLRFLVERFGPAFQLVQPPASGWGSQNPYEGGRKICAFITMLGSQKTESAKTALKAIIANESLGNLRDHARHILAQHIRTMAEIIWQQKSLEGVRQLLLSGPPETIDDLQSLLMDELEALQRRLKDGIYNGTAPYWNQDQPHCETYCRDRIGEQLEPFLSKYGVRVHTEGTMPDDKRCDLLCTIGEFDLPIEIKGQWHGEVWNSACLQLEDNYSRNYRAEGRGVYLVLWFGNVAGKNPPGILTIGRPANASEMLDRLRNQSPREISPLTKLLVLDVS